MDVSWDCTWCRHTHTAILSISVPRHKYRFVVRTSRVPIRTFVTEKSIKESIQISNLSISNTTIQSLYVFRALTLRLTEAAVIISVRLFLLYLPCTFCVSLISKWRVCSVLGALCSHAAGFKEYKELITVDKHLWNKWSHVLWHTVSQLFELSIDPKKILFCHAATSLFQYYFNLNYCLLESRLFPWLESAFLELLMQKAPHLLFMRLLTSLKICKSRLKLAHNSLLCLNLF